MFRAVALSNDGLNGPGFFRNNDSVRAVAGLWVASIQLHQVYSASALVGLGKDLELVELNVFQSGPENRGYQFHLERAPIFSGKLEVVCRALFIAFEISADVEQAFGSQFLDQARRRHICVLFTEPQAVLGRRTGKWLVFHCLETGKRIIGVNLEGDPVAQ